MKLMLALFASAAITGCATGPHAVGSGDWMQVLEGGRVVAEYNTRDAGHMTCAHQVHQFHLKATQCANAPSTEHLPYSYTVQNMNTESEGFRRSSPYTWRMATAARCQRGLAYSIAQPKVVAVRANCT